MADSFSVSLEQWSAFLTGNTSPDKTAMRYYLRKLDIDAKKLFSHIEITEKSLWQDLDIAPVFGTDMPARFASERLYQTCLRLRTLTYAWATEGTAHYHDIALGDVLLAALDTMFAKFYTCSDEIVPFYGNWWCWEIGCPQALLECLLLLYDRIPIETIRRYILSVERFTPAADKTSGYPLSPEMTGANLIDKAVVVALTGILTRDEGKLCHMHDAVKSVFSYVKSGDGFYRDGSFIQHQAIAYMGGYGLELFARLSLLFTALRNTPWSFEDESMLFAEISKGVKPFFYNGRFMDMVSGRSIVRKNVDDRQRGMVMTAAVLPLVLLMQEGEGKSTLLSLLRSNIEREPLYYYANCRSAAAALLGADLLNREDITHYAPRKGMATFRDMDRAVYTAERYTMGLAMCSDRTYGHELINDEGKRTWNISDGATYLYQPGNSRYGNGYWATVDPLRLPGTTVERIVHSDGAWDRKCNIYNKVGSAAFGQYGCAWMETRSLGNNDCRNGAYARKSWCFLGDVVVCAGDFISSNTGNMVETIVDNIPLYGVPKIIVDNQPMKLQKDVETVIHAPSKLFVGQEDNSCMIFPEQCDVHLLYSTRKGDWQEQGTDFGEVCGDYLTVWISHGASPKNERYTYLLLPSYTHEELAQFPLDKIAVCFDNDSHIVRSQSPSLWKGEIAFRWAEERVTVKTYDDESEFSMKNSEGC